MSHEEELAEALLLVLNVCRGYRDGFTKLERLDLEVAERVLDAHLAAREPAVEDTYPDEEDWPPYSSFREEASDPTEPGLPPARPWRPGEPPR